MTLPFVTVKTSSHMRTTAFREDFLFDGGVAIPDSAHLRTHCLALAIC